MDPTLLDIVRQRPQLIYAAGVIALFLVVLGGSGLYVLIKARLTRERPVEGSNVFKSEPDALAQPRA